jgi:transforming growth factor-beta-induced protein
MRLAMACLIASIIGLLPALASAGDRTITTFDGQDSLRWQTVNDGVMGGRSQGGPSFSEDGTLLFTGEISLENNGGFSSIRTRPADLGLGGYDGLEIRVRGDGRTYKLALRSRGLPNWIAYWADFETREGTWTTVRIPFAKWVPTTFGRRLTGPKLRPAAVDSIGFMLYDKKAGPFSLEVDSIAAYRGEAAAAPEPARESSTILDTARAAGTFKTLLAAAKAAGLTEALSAPGPITVFAPSDEAFGRLPEGTVASLLEPENKTRLRTLLLHHVIESDVSLPALLRTPRLKTLAGQRLEVQRSGSTLRVGGATIDTAGLRCDNGVIHVVDRVLLPELRDLATVAVEAKTFTTLVAAAKAAGLVEALTGEAPLTVFAPSDEAFARLPEGTVARLLEPGNRGSLQRLLLHHIVRGRVHADAAAAAGTAKSLAGTTLRFGYERGLKVNGTPILMPDLPARNGVIHVVEAVLLPAASASQARGSEPSSPAKAIRIIERAIDIGVDLYNGGNVEGCCTVYELAVTSLLGLDEELFSSSVRKRLAAALDSDESADARAWTLRRALDAAAREVRARLGK